MLRESHIPLFLWLPAALIFHALSGGGAHQAAQVARGRDDIRAFSREVRDVIHGQLRAEVAILPGDGEDLIGLKPDPPKPEEEKPEEAKELPKEKEEPPPVVKLPPQAPPKIKPKAPPKVAKVEPPKPKVAPEPEKKIEPPKVAENKPKPKEDKKPEPEKKEEPQKIELPKPDGRIAVINDPNTEKNQKDNPNAPRIADEANTTKEERMARFLSYDQNASRPNGGGGPGDPSQPQPGNAEKDERGFSNDVKGEKDPRAGSEGGPTDPETTPIARSTDGSNKPIPGQHGAQGEKPVAPIEGGKGETAPDIISSADGDQSWSLNPDGDGKPKKKGRKGRKGRAAQPYIPGSPGDALAQYSINAYGLSEALGSRHLRREQEKARNTRIAKHRGSMKGNEFEKYRAAIQNYDPSVKPGNQTSLNAARVPFASYINKMHNAIHPIFADGFLGSLGKLDASDKLNDPKLSTHIEVVLNGESGAVVAAGIVRGSGVTAFDVAAIRSIYAAGPYGKAPDIIVSPDGNVYVHWEFYRDPYFACTSKFAMPYKLKDGTKNKDDKPGPRKPTRRSKERTASKGKKKN
jgi:hypothetical protein